jgi:twitching motility protein PilT
MCAASTWNRSTTRAVHAMVYDIMNDSQRKNYEEFLEIDFSFEIEGLARFRVNAFNQQRGAGAVFRTIPSKILTLEQLNARRSSPTWRSSRAAWCW